MGTLGAQQTMDAVPVGTVDDLAAADAVIFGTPTRLVIQTAEKENIPSIFFTRFLCAIQPLPMQNYITTLLNVTVHAIQSISIYSAAAEGKIGTKLLPIIVKKGAYHQ